MLMRMLAKEWKEKFGLFLFAIAGFLLFGLAFSGYAGNREVRDILFGTITLVFLPIFSLLLGANGFASEFKDDAWAYLFSRPVKKWQIWLTKYISLLSVLVAVLLIFTLIAELHPALRAARQTFSIPLSFGEDISFLALAYLLPLSLFTAAFSFSLLSEKSHVVVFLAALITYALYIGLTLGPPLLALAGIDIWSAYRIKGLSLLGPLISLSFAAASALTLSRADFSQPGRRAWVFTKFAAIFLAASLGIGTIWTFGSMKMQRTARISYPEVLKGSAYFATDKGIYRFDLAKGRRQKISSARSIWGDIVIGGDKIAFFKFIVRKGLMEYEDLWIMNADGRGVRPLVETSREESPLFGAYFYSVSVSPAGDKVAFIAWRLGRKIPQDLWSINADGMKLKGYAVNLPSSAYSRILGFVDSSRYVLISSTPQGKAGWQEGAKLLRVDLESGAVETLTEHTHGAQLQSGAGSDPSKRLVAYAYSEGNASNQTLVILDALTLERREVYTAASINGLRWNQAGNKLAFVARPATVGIYSLAEGKITEIKDLPGYDFRWPAYAFDWISGDQLAFRKFDKDISTLCFMDSNLTEWKTLRFPFQTYYTAQLRGAEHYAFVIDNERYQLWGADLNSDRWRRIY
jgi:ABC-type transport system involved in multi-copper enzyme maturation permease subunit